MPFNGCPIVILNHKSESSSAPLVIPVVFRSVIQAQEVENPASSSIGHVECL